MAAAAQDGVSRATWFKAVLFNLWMFGALRVLIDNSRNIPRTDISDASSTPSAISSRSSSSLAHKQNSSSTLAEKDHDSLRPILAKAEQERDFAKQDANAAKKQAESLLKKLEEANTQIQKIQKEHEDDQLQQKLLLRADHGKDKHEAKQYTQKAMLEIKTDRDKAQQEAKKLQNQLEQLKAELELEKKRKKTKEQPVTTTTVVNTDSASPVVTTNVKEEDKNKGPQGTTGGNTDAASQGQSSTSSTADLEHKKIRKRYHKQTRLDLAKTFELPPNGKLMPNADPQHSTKRLEDSGLPETISLFSNLYNPDAYSKAVQKRHLCIAKIRRHQVDVLSPLILGQDPPKRQPPHNYLMIVDPSYHANVGDTMLSLGELTFASRLGFANEQMIQCHYAQAGKHFYPCEETLQNQSSLFWDQPNNPGIINPPLPPVAMWQAGGNWGDVWRVAQPKRIQSMTQILSTNHTLIGMPQSLVYESPQKGDADAQKMRDNILQGIYGNRPDPSILDTKAGLETVQSRVYFTWREYESHEKAKEMYPFATNLVVPDIAFQIGPYEPIRQSEAAIPKPGAEKVDIVFFLRSDKESAVAGGHRSREYIQDVLTNVTQTAKNGNKNVTFTIVDWQDRIKLFDDRHPLSLVSAIKLLSLGRVVVCDRLHATILAYLTGLPLVYIDQMYGKISKTLRVAFDSWPGDDGCHDTETTMVAKASDLSDATRKALDFLGKYNL